MQKFETKLGIHLRLTWRTGRSWKQRPWRERPARRRRRRLESRSWWSARTRCL